jgi:NADPH:quinone reductase-like Zn-dependent oxidoreductase
LKRQSIRFDEFGAPVSVLKLKDEEVTPLQDNEILVEMIMAPINPSDLIPVTGAYRHRISLPFVPGYEGVGVVNKVGCNVNPNLLNQRVLPLRGEGTWQSFVKAPADYAVLIPEHINDDTAATLYINPLTALLICSEHLKLKPGDTIAVNACSSFLGRIFAQLSRKLGFTLIAVVRNDKHTEELKALGASFVINTAKENMTARIHRLTNGRGLDAGVDCIGGQAGTELAFSIREHGVFTALGLLSNTQPAWDKIYKETSIKVELFHLRHWNKALSPAQWQQYFKILINMVSKGELNLNHVDRTYELADVRSAIQYLGSLRKKDGKVFLTNQYRK